MILKGDEIDVGYDFDSLLKLNTAMGSAGVIALDERCCMVQLGIRVSEFYEHESCGKCTPCREGTRWMTQILRKLEAGDASQGELDLLLTSATGSTASASARSATRRRSRSRATSTSSATSSIAHVDSGGCPFGDSSPLEGVLAPVDRSTAVPHEPRHDSSGRRVPEASDERARDSSR